LFSVNQFLKLFVSLTGFKNTKAPKTIKISGAFKSY
jgi:hypothetical protein